MSEGTVVAVCLSPSSGVPKHPQGEVKIGAFGVDGDYHAGEYRTSKGKTEVSRRHVTVVAAEALEAVSELIGVPIPNGGVGENVLVRDLGDLGDVEPGQRLKFSSGVELEVTGQNNPCANLQVYHEQAPKHLYGRRGLLTVVLQTGVVRPGDTITIA